MDVKICLQKRTWSPDKHEDPRKQAATPGSSEWQDALTCPADQKHFLICLTYVLWYLSETIDVAALGIETCGVVLRTVLLACRIVTTFAHCTSSRLAAMIAFLYTDSPIVPASACDLAVLSSCAKRIEIFRSESPSRAGKDLTRVPPEWVISSFLCDLYISCSLVILGQSADLCVSRSSMHNRDVL